MLASAATIEAVSSALEKRRRQLGRLDLVVDPVMVATSGAQLLPPEAVAGLCGQLLPQATVLTPNIPEARLLLSTAGQGHMPADSVADLETMARAIRALGPAWVLVKGGHAPFRRDYSAARTPDERHLVVDVLVGPGLDPQQPQQTQTVIVETPYIDSKNTHGTGCSLACTYYRHCRPLGHMLARAFC